MFLVRKGLVVCLISVWAREEGFLKGVVCSVSDPHKSQKTTTSTTSLTSKHPPKQPGTEGK